MNKLKSIVFSKKFFALIIAAAVLGYWYLERRPEEQTAQTTTPQYRDITQTLEITGAVNAEKIANLTFQAGGRLAWVGVEEGDEVTQWQALASLDTRQLQKQLEQELNSFNKVLRNRDQTLDDYDYYGNSPKDREMERILENANFDLQSSALAVEIRDLAVRLSSIVSPIDGTVVRIDKPDAGANVSITDTIQVINFNTLYFQAYVDEEDVPTIKEFIPTIVELDAFSDTPIESSISAIAKIPTNTETGTGYEVKIPLENNLNIADQLRIGMNGTAQIIIDQKPQALTLESETLISRDGQLYVDVLEGDEIVQIPVEIGLETDEYVEIISGLDDNAQVILPTQSSDE